MSQFSPRSRPSQPSGSRRRSARSPAPVRKAPNAHQLPVLQPDAAALDVGATLIHAALPPERAPETVRVFETFTEDLEALARWFVQHRIKTVAMEATGVYWIPVFQVLEAHGLEVCLVNARHVKNVRGRKTDISDCQWLQLLHSVGLLAASFQPPEAIAAVRALFRQRVTLVQQAATAIQHMQKALTQMNLQIHHALSDLTGVSGLRILDALLAGERDPERLAELCDPGVQATPETLQKALRGNWRPELLFVLGQARAQYRFLQEQLQACDAEVLRLLECFDSQADPADLPPPKKNAPRGKRRKGQVHGDETELRRTLFRLYGTDLTQAPGLGAPTVLALFAELGTDLSAFPSGKHFASWTGLCPDPRKSGGKVLRQKRRDVQHRVALSFRLAAQSLHHSDSALGRFYRYMRAKLGGPQAVTATAHKLARVFYHLVTTKEAYDETAFAQAEAARQLRRLRRLEHEAKSFGFSLTPLEPTPCVS